MNTKILIIRSVPDTGGGVTTINNIVIFIYYLFNRL